MTKRIIVISCCADCPSISPDPDLELGDGYICIEYKIRLRRGLIGRDTDSRCKRPEMLEKGGV